MAVTLSSKSKHGAKKQTQADQELIHTSLKRFQVTAEAESDTRRKELEDLKFSIGTGQWDEAVKANREIEGKPCLTLNRAPTFLRQYTGEERQHRPAMIVDPVGNGADEDTADICQGVLRHVEVASRADVVYDNSYDWMLRTGRSNWRIKTDYIAENSFHQEPRIEWIENAFSVYMSPIRKPDGTDPLWCHVVEDLSKEEYEAKYGKTEIARLNFSTSEGNAQPGWVTKSGARIAEYWYLELTPARLCLMPDGSTQFREDIKDPLLLQMIQDERETVRRKVCCVKHDAMQVLERYEYLGKYIPILELNGVRLNVDGKIYRAGFVRDYRDAQRIYDFMVTRQVEQVDLYSKDPLFVAEGSITNHEEEYRQLNRKSFPYMYYKAVSDSGSQLPPPTRASREPPIQAMSAIVQQADYDMKAIVGIYGTGPGEHGTANESAFAVLTRKQQTDAGTINWSDNLNRTIQWQGQILLDLFPKLIDSARIQRIINPDDSVKHAVVMNSAYGGQQEAQQMLDQKKGLTKVYDVGVGSYDVTLSSGPQSSTGRQEAFKALTAIATESPQLFPTFADIWAKYADWPGAHVLSDRFKKMLPPNLQDQDNNDPAQQVTALQAQLQALSQQHNQLVAELSRASDTIRTTRLQIESKERIAAMQAQAGMVEALLKANLQAGMQAMQAELDTIKDRMVMVHENMSVEQEAGAAPDTPELPNQVEPKVQPVTPAQPVARPQPIPEQ